MGWAKSRAEERINNYRTSVPKNDVLVESFDHRFTREILLHESLGARRPTSRSVLTKIPPSQAVLVHGVHVYIQLIDYHVVLQDIKRESEPRHRRALKFLHTHYAASDKIVSEYEAQRVDYHGPRLHAVIATPSGAGDEPERVRRAIAFAKSMKRMIETTGRRVLGGEFETRVRIGIDTGMAIAVNSGRGDEQEPLFLGDPANYAAKLADGSEAGIFLSDRVRRILGLFELRDIQLEKRLSWEEIPNKTSLVHDAVSDDLIQMMAEDVKREVEPQIRDTDFVFHRHQPPLSTIDYSLLKPSNSIHMPMLSMFADISGFTAYVSQCIRDGQVQELVSNLHVIRKELAAVLKKDFEGRKVRFIGDCLHGLLAEGTKHETDAQKTVEKGVLCAGGMRSSFELCKSMLPGISNLGLAIGLEYGSTPVTRLGNRGDLSVRCATSKAVSESESIQSNLNGEQTGIGLKAHANAPVRVQRLFGNSRVVPGLDYAAATTFLLSTPAVASNSGEAIDYRPHSVRF